jgi:hypothetical protein
MRFPGPALAAFAVTTFMAGTPPAAAEPPAVTAAPRTTLGADGIGVLPVGDYGRVATLGVGVLGRLEVPAGPGFLTGRLGAIFHAVNGTNAGLSLVPLYAGYRLPLGTGGGYVAGELGVTVLIGSADTALGRMSVSDEKLGLTLGGGLRRGPLDLRAGLFAPDIDHAVGFMASAGYDFAAF